jgi:DNA-binding beta-propeller fold protein YncE
MSPVPASRWRFRITLLAVGLALIGGLVAAKYTARSAAGAADEANADEPERRVKAPENMFDGGVAWLNTAGPLKLADLRGKIVVLDFWTFCCINCIHTLPDLAKLEKKYADQVVVVGVHSAKFEREKDTEAIRKAVLRYQISHPVVNDANMAIWNRLGVESWPTIAVLDPEGYFVYAGSGEGQYPAVERVIDRLIAKHRADKTLNEKPMRFDLARSREKGDTPLYFPGKVLADAAGNRLFIADSTHHRVVVTDLQGNKKLVVGTGEPGYLDGPGERAQFNDPQGMALKGETVFVADRKNHLIRALDLKTGTVSTAAGTGKQAGGLRSRQRGGPALETSLNSPWDLLLVGERLYVAMAGHHQIWALDLARQQITPYAGDGMENIQDGSLAEAEFAQPSGLTTDGKRLYVADSEASAVRAVPLPGSGDAAVRTVVGASGRGLFRFGDADGPGDKARLQHALGVLYHDGKVYVADTYNSKLKVIDPASRTCATFLAGDAGGWVNGPLFNEPAGLTYADGKLYVADTNAHRIRVVDLKTKAVSTLELKGVEPPAAVNSTGVAPGNQGVEK